MKPEEHAKSLPRPSIAASDEVRVASRIRAASGRITARFRAWAVRSWQFRLWSPVRQIGQFALNVSIMAAAVGVVIQCSRMAGPNPSTYESQDILKLRPVSFTADEIFLPRSLLARAKDEALRDILVGRDVDRLDRYMETNGLRDAWFLIRYRGLDADGSTWRNFGSTFDCKRYHVHRSRIGVIENRRGNLEVFARAMARSAGREPDDLLAAGRALDPTVGVIRFDRAKIVPIPDEAMGIEHIHRTDIDAWRDLATKTAR